MASVGIKESIVIGIHAFVGWAVCGLTMAIGMATMSLPSTLILHAIVAPVAFSLISLVYFKKFCYTSALWTAILFLAFVILMDVFVVALVIEKSFDMFRSPLGTWIPFLLIFASTYVTGRYARRQD